MPARHRCSLTHWHGRDGRGRITSDRTSLKRLPDLPFSGFDSERMTLSETALALGVPDATLSLVSLAANVPLAGVGIAGRASTQSLVANRRNGQGCR